MTDTRTDTTTPLRELDCNLEDGCRVLSQTAVDYVEGAEERVLEIIEGATDLSSLSDELEEATNTWHERYNLSRDRANILRALSLPAGATVLEVGAGCGAITRYLGETCGIVDALEPVLARARVARARTRDLPNVEVFAGGVDDLPLAPAYDLVVLVGVLEYSGEGSADPATYESFLSRLAQVLKPGGAIVCAIENKIGVKYLAGAPENHTTRPFDGLEGYPLGARVRTFSRPELARVFEGAGLQPAFLHALPDYHLARIVYSDALLDTADGRVLAVEVPAFPSPDWAGYRPRLADERSLWRTLVEGGLGADCANAFVVVASKGTPAADIWPDGLLASFYSRRRALFGAATRVWNSSGTVQLERSRLGGDERRVESPPITLEAGNAPFVSGASLVDVLAASDDGAIAEWLRRWHDLLKKHVEEAGPGQPVSIDVGPHHMIIDEEGKAHLIDQEMWHDSYGEEELAGRHLLWLAVYLAERTPASRWNFDTVRDLAVWLGGLIGLDPEGGWLDETVAREAQLQAHVGYVPGSAHWPQMIERLKGHLHEMLSRRLEDMGLGVKEHELRQRAEAMLDEERKRAAAAEESFQREIATLQRHIERKQGELDGLYSRISEIENSTGWRMLNRVRPILRRVAPMGSPQRRLLLGGGRAGYRLMRRLAARVRPSRPAMSPGDISPSRKPRANRLRVGAYGEHCWSVGGGTVHALQLLIPLSEFYDVDLLIPPGTPLRDRKWYRENLLIDIGDIKVRHYKPGAETQYDVWFSIWNERIWPSPVRKRFNMVFFPFVKLDGSGWTHITNSEYSKRYVEERYGASDIIIAYPTVNADEYRNGPKEPMILHCSRFALPSAYADKAHVMMIQAFKRLCEKGLTGWKLVLAGATLDEGERTYVNHLAKHAHGYPIEFALNLSASELRELFARASVYWHGTGYSVKEPAAQEHFGITIVEGMASGAVPVSFNSGGPPEIITSGENGYLFDTLEEMVEQTWKLASEPDHWRKLSGAARERARFFSADKVRTQMLDAVSKTHKVSIIMGTHNNLEVLRRAVDSILAVTPPGYELIVVDNNSSDGTATYLASLDYPHLKVVRNPDNPGFAIFNNRGLEHATREYVLYLNDDVEALPGWLEPLIETLDADPRVGAAGSRLFYPDGRIQHDGKMFSRDGLAPKHVNIGGKPVEDESAIEVDALTAACLLVRRELAGFSEDYKRGYYEDTDLCLRIKDAGYALVLHRGSVLIHYHGMSFGRDQKASEESQEQNRKIFLDRWSERIPGLVYLASEQEMQGREIRCKPVIRPNGLDPWPVTRRLAR